MKTLTSISILLFIAVSIAHAQKGSVITTKQDTLHGKISFAKLGPYQMDEVLVKNDDGKQRLSPIEVKRVLRGDESFVPVKIDQKYQFAKVIKEGHLSLYRYMNPETNSLEDFSMDIMIKKDGSMHKFSRIAFTKGTAKFLNECPAVRQRKSDGTLKIKYLSEIVDEYNDWAINSNTSESVVTKSPFHSFIEKVRAQEALVSNVELFQMLNDVNEKLQSNKPVPGYLSSGIKNYLQDHPDLKDQFDKLVN